MIRPAALLTALTLLLAAGSASAKVDGFIIVNATGAALGDFSVRRVGATDWRALPVAATAGPRIQSSFADEDCAFDLRASVPGARPVVWNKVNLCDVKSVTLNRDSSGRTWVDYD